MSAPARDNPMGTDGFEFVEFAAPEPLALDGLFRSLGFLPVARHRSKDVTLYRQGGINFILNAEPESFAQAFARVHGPSVCAIGLRVRDAREAANTAKALGADVLPGNARPGELNIPAIRGIGGSLIYLVDRFESPESRVSLYDIDFVPIRGAEPHPRGQGLTAIDHLGVVVHRGRQGLWAGFWERLFGFAAAADGEIVSPCDRIRLRIAECTDSGDPLSDTGDHEGMRDIALAVQDIGTIATRQAELGPMRFRIVQA